jgi:hypothetical protein
VGCEFVRWENLVLHRPPTAYIFLVIAGGFLLASCGNTTGSSAESTTTATSGSTAAVTTVVATTVVPTTAQFQPTSFDPPTEPERPYSFVAGPELLEQGETVTLTFPEGSVFDSGTNSCWRLRVWDSDSGWRDTLWIGGQPEGKIVQATPPQLASQDCTDAEYVGPEDLVLPDDIIPAWYQVCRMISGLCSNPFLVTTPTISG